MPSPLVNMSSVVLCSHGGKATPVVPNPRVLISGAPSVTISSPFVIAGCALPPPPVANGPCVTGQIIMGTKRVLSNGQPLVAQLGVSTCAPTGTPMIVAFGNARVMAE
ncbi:MAG: hypothetical protein H6741_31795 [Alphaproteobacteria bacterium]|nr:hypothetical protein [Alphaproteobacteria bacterium]